MQFIARSSSRHETRDDHKWLQQRVRPHSSDRRAAATRVLECVAKISKVAEQVRAEDDAEEADDKRIDEDEQAEEAQEDAKDDFGEADAEENGDERF